VYRKRPFLGLTFIGVRRDLPEDLPGTGTAVCTEADRFRCTYGSDCAGRFARRFVHNSSVIHQRLF
jgi:hypothetical protein